MIESRRLTQTERHKTFPVSRRRDADSSPTRLINAPHKEEKGSFECLPSEHPVHVHTSLLKCTPLWSRAHLSGNAHTALFTRTPLWSHAHCSVHVHTSLVTRTLLSSRARMPLFPFFTFTFSSTARLFLINYIIQMHLHLLFHQPAGEHLLSKANFGSEAVCVCLCVCLCVFMCLGACVCVCLCVCV